MSDQQFVHPLGLKSRLLGCLFSPLVVVPAVVYLFTIWTVHTIAAPHGTAVPPAALPGAPLLPAAGPAAPAGGTLWPPAAPTFDVRALDDALRRYLDESLTTSAQTLDRYIRENYNHTVDASLRAWNETLSSSIKLLHELLLQQQRQSVSISGELQSQGQRIRGAVKRLTETGLSVGSDLGPRVSDMHLDDSFLAPLYKDVNSTIKQLPSLIPAAFPAFKWAPLNLSSVRREADQVRREALHLYANRYSGDLRRRSTPPALGLAARHTAVVAALTAAALVLRCAGEWFAFHLQNHAIVRAALEAHEPPCTGVALTAWRHAAIRALAAAHEHPFVYCALRPMRDLAPRAWRRASTWALWCGAHGGALLWFLLFVALTDWQLAVATLPHAQRLHHRAQPADAADVVANLHAALETRLRPALRDAHAAALGAAADHLHRKLAPLLARIDSSRPSVLPLPALIVPQPVWPAWPPAADLAPVIRAAIPRAHPLRLASRSIPAPQFVAVSLSTVFRPAVIVIAVLIIIHHLVGLLLVLRTR